MTCDTVYDWKSCDSHVYSSEAVSTATLTLQTGANLLELTLLGHLQELGELAEAEHGDERGGQVQQRTAASIFLMRHH